MKTTSLPTAIKLTTLFLVLAGFTIMLVGCPGNPPKDFSLAIIVADKLGEKKTDKLPQEIIDLCLPIEDCKQFVLLPKAVLHRLGFDKSAERSLETRIEGGFAGNKNSSNLIKRKIEAHLSSEEIGETYTKPNEPSLNLLSTFDAHLASIGKQSLVLIFSTMGAQEDTYRGIKIYTTLDSLRARIASEICENNFSSAIVFLNPPTISSQPPEPVVNKPQSTSLTSEIERRNIKIAEEKSQSERKALVTQTVEEYKPKIGDDPFALYALSKTIIYGQEHHEAFELLSEAAEIAIKQGRASELYQRISDDIEKDLLKKDIRDRTIWRLSTPDHKNHWLPIISALTKKDASLLHHE